MKKLIPCLLLFFLSLYSISVLADTEVYLEAKDYITMATTDMSSSIQAFLTTCKNQGKNAYFNQGVYRFASNLSVVEGVDIVGEAGTVFQAIDEQCYVTNSSAVNNITIEHIVFDNMSIWSKSNSTGWTIRYNVFMNARNTDVTMGCAPDSSGKNGGPSTGYYVHNNRGTMTILSNMFLRNSESLGRGIATYYTEDVLIQDNFFGRLEDVEGSIVSNETKALKEIALATGLVDESEDQGYFMTGINVINSDVNTRIIGNYLSFNTNITEAGYEDGSQSTGGYNRDHMIYAKAFDGLTIVGNYFKGMNKNQDGGVKCRNGENLFIYRNVLEDTLILLYVQNDATGALLKNVDIRENIFINKAYDTTRVTIPYGDGKTLTKYLTIDFSILFLNYVATSDVDSITISSNLFYSEKLANEQIRIDNGNSSYDVPTNIYIANNKNILGNTSRVTIRNVPTTVDVYQDWNNGSEYRSSKYEDYSNIDVQDLASIKEIDFEITSNYKLVASSANKIYVDGVVYNNQALSIGKHFIFLSSTSTDDILVEDSIETISTHLYTAMEIEVKTLYTVTFNTNNHGTTPSSIKVSSLPDELPILTASDWVFCGWYLDAALTIPAQGQELTSNITLYAKWIDVSKTYTINYNHNGHGTQPDSVEQATELPNELPVLIEDGYTFEGWYLDASFTQTAEPGQTLESDVTLYAKWTKNPYIISFVINNHGEQPNSIEATEKIPILLPNLEEEGYTFDGWYVDEELTTKVVLGSSLSQNITLYAKWTAITYKVYFANVEMDAIIVPYNGKITKPTNPILEGYTFAGWYKEKECINAWNFVTDVVTKTMTLYAKWEQVEESLPTYTILFNSQGGSTVESQKIQEGSKITMPATPTYEGYTFVGWYKEKECINAWNFATDVVTKAMTLYAKWEQVEEGVPTYTILFNSQGGSTIDSQRIQEGGKVTKPATPTYEGYTFEGWYKEKECINAWNFTTDVVEADITLYAKWTEVSSTIPSNPGQQNPTAEDTSTDLVTILSISISIGVGVLGLCALAILVIRKKRS